jgi:hypothetical protein
LQPANVAGLSDVLGDDLPGAQGLTPIDQRLIDQTVARGCAGGVFTRAACDRHTAASAARWRAIQNQKTTGRAINGV